jgi:RsiW-degrading membrane proteinase PrsW (M82 family)
MLFLATGLFVLAALGGLFLLTRILTNKPVPEKVAMIHGSVAVMGLLLLVAYMVFTGTSPQLNTSATVLIFAALGGLTMLGFGLKKKSIPKIIAVIHPLVALTGLALLIDYLFKR